MKRYFLLLAVLAKLLTAVPAYAQRALLPVSTSGAMTAAGRPCASCKLWSYVAGTTTAKSTYPTSNGVSANANPVILNAAGRAQVWYESDTSYKFILEDATCAYRDEWGTCHGATIWTIDALTDWGGSFAAGATVIDGDVSGGYNASTVEKIQGISVSTTDPTANQVLVYSGGAWTPTAVPLTSSAAVTGILGSANGGTGNGFTKFSGPATAEKTFTLPNASDTIATYAVKNTFSKAQIVTPVDLTVAAADGTIATDASLSNHFRVTLTTDCPCTLSTPTNPTDGQRVTWEVIQASGGSETLAYSAAFAYGTTVSSPTITITGDKRDFIEAVYNSTAGKWFVLNVVQGY